MICSAPPQDGQPQPSGACRALLARQMTGQRPAAGFLPGLGGRLRRRRITLRFEGGELFLDHLQAQRQLIRMALLRRAAEPLAAQRREKQLQLLDLGIAGGEPGLALVEFGRLPVEVTRQVA
jgi:hypothetical protein